MTDREKVIKGLECCMSEKICNSPCPYRGQCDDGGYYFSKAIEDAIELLKAQEPIEPIEFYDDTKCVEDYNRTLAWKCGKCGYYIGGADNFCANCGQAVKWE